MSYVLKVNGKKQSQGYGRLQAAINVALSLETEDVKIVDDGVERERIVWTKQAKEISDEKTSY